MTRFRLDISYAGTDFVGWADQPGLRTVQGVLETWVPRVLRYDEPVRLTCAGRTDAGVHARGQVAHLDLDHGDQPAAEVGRTLTRRLARVLPADLVVRRVVLASDGFDARFSAVWRRYVYRLWDHEVPPDPLQSRMIATHRGPLDLDAMNSAGARLVGLRDFGAFCRRREGATTTRTLLDLAGTRVRDGPADGLIEMTVRADAFCHSMVRSLMGGLAAVGSGRRDVDWLVAVTARAERDSAIQVMPAAGLTLEEVGYPDDSELARRAAESRAMRS